MTERTFSGVLERSLLDAGMFVFGVVLAMAVGLVYFIWVAELALGFTAEHARFVFGGGAALTWIFGWVLPRLAFWSAILGIATVWLSAVIAQYLFNDPAVAHVIASLIPVLLPACAMHIMLSFGQGTSWLGVASRRAPWTS